MSLFRLIWKGLSLRGQPDAIHPDKSPCAVNVRSYSDSSIRTRPGYATNFSTGANAVTDLRCYTALSTDNNPRTLAVDNNGGVWLDTGSSVGNLAGPQGLGANLISFRPGASPLAWMYISGNNDYQKFSAPSNNAVTAYAVGIAEPQNQCEFGPANLARVDFTRAAANWTNQGNAGSPADGNRTLDTVVTMLADPIIPFRYSVQPGTTNNSTYGTGQLLSFFDANNNNLAGTQIELVLPPLPTGNVAQIQAIHYDAGNTGNCTIVPTQLPIANASQLGYLQRGCLLLLGGNETVFVQSSVDGQSGLVSIRTSTNNTWGKNATIGGLPAVVVNANKNLTTATTVTSASITSTLTAGANNASTLCSITLASGTNPFVSPISGNNLAQQDDYLHISLWANNSAAINEIKWLFNVDPDTGNFNKNVLYFSIRPSDLTGVNANLSTQQSATSTSASSAFIASQVTAIQSNIDQLEIQLQSTSDPAAAQQIQAAIGQLQNQAQQLQIAAAAAQASAGANQWTEIMFPISGLTRIGTDETKTLFNCTQIQVLWNVNNNANVAISSLWFGGGGQPDIGDSGAPLMYRVVPRGSTTGATGNPSPIPYYGVIARRQPITVVPPSLAYDPQIDVYDVYRYGGSVPSWRYIGTGTAGNNFTDNFFDDTAQAGQVLIADNYQPWPSVDVPFKVVSGGSNSISLYGTSVVVSTAAANWPASITRWLPGTEVQIDQLNVYPLAARPVAVNNTTYLFQFATTTGAGNANTFAVQEPSVARQINQYTWGPDASGAMFGVGDPLRPGTVSYTKFNLPDAVSDQGNIDLCPPPEPLLGGEVIGGLSFVASFDRWWALYPGFNNSSAYTPNEMPVGRGLAAPRGLGSDGKSLYWWAKDCIARSGGGGYEDLTSLDLYPLFPHEGVKGANVVRNGVTFFAPDYSRAGTFRIEPAGKFLYADYQDSTGTPRTLVLNLETGAWSTDSYADPISVHYAVEQPEGGLLTAGNAYSLVLLADKNGKVWTETDLHNDNSTPIACNFSTYEWNGGQERAASRWYDFYLDANAASNITAAPQFLSALAPGCANTVIAAGNNRQLSQVKIGDGVSQRFLGLYATWSDNFAGVGGVTSPTVLYQWGAFCEPDGVSAWRTPFIDHGLTGYMHAGRLEIGYISNAAVTLSISVYDGTAPSNMTLPSTSGAFQKALLTPTFNKGRLYRYSATSSQPFQILLPNSTIWLGSWQRSSPYLPYRLSSTGK